VDALPAPAPVTLVTESADDAPVPSPSPPAHTMALAAAVASYTASHPGSSGVSFTTVELPEGEVTTADIAAIAALLEAGARDITYPLIFAKLAGKRRHISGEVLRPVLRQILSKANVAPPVTAGSSPIEGQPGDIPREAIEVLTTLVSQIQEIRTGADFLEMNFNFGPGVKETMIKIPGTYNWVLEQKYKEDPYLVHKLNTPRYLMTDPRTLIFKSQVRFTMSPQGIAGMREGDIQLKAAFLKLNAGMRTEHKPGTIEYDSGDRPYIEMLGHNRPVIVDDHYVPRRLSDWLVVTVLKKDIWIGLPDLSPSSSSSSSS